MIRRKQSLCILFGICISVLVFGQKKILTPNDYDLWTASEYFSRGEVSNNGEWVAYNVSNRNGDRSVFLRHKKGTTHHFKMQGEQYYFDYNTKLFSEDSKWFAHRHADTLTILRLSDGQRQVYTGIYSFTFVARGQYLLVWDNKEKGKTIWIRNLNNNRLDSFKNVLHHSASPNNDMLAIVVQHQGYQKVDIISLKKGFPAKSIATDDNADFTNLTWNKSGSALAFMSVIVKDSTVPTLKEIFVSRNLTTTPLTTKLDTQYGKDFPASGYYLPLRLFVADDGKALSFDLRPRENTLLEQKQQKVKVWNTEDRELSIQDYYDDPVAVTEKVWFTDSNFLSSVGDTLHPYALMNGNFRWALMYNRKTYLPRHKYINEFIDIYMKDYVTGRKKLVAQQVKEEKRSVSLSPSGRYVAYYKDKNWWIYDGQTDTTSCITASLGITFEDTNSDINGIKPACGFGGWVDGDKAILLADQFDIWLVNIDNSKKLRITDGRSTNRVFRVYEPRIFQEGPGRGFKIFLPRVHDARKGIFITSVNEINLDNGCWVWNKDQGLIKLVEQNKKITHLTLPTSKAPFLYYTTDFDQPPVLSMVNSSVSISTTLHATDQFQQSFHWGRSMLISYKNTSGKLLKGALFFPANYQPGKKYPLIVEIYEKKSREMHDYVVPSYEEILNRTIYTSEGYFVLLPDIHYNINDPGMSALDCVTAAVQSTIDSGWIDKEKIGLIGHSFGGYETSFIISQTNMFRTAVAGAAITDLPDWSLLFSESFGLNMSRVENGQFRMQEPFYGDAYRRNSPIDNIADIQTPLLIWTGDRDANVTWTQSLKLHAGLWRLGKKSTLVVYKDEDHILVDPDNKRDFTLKLKDWFGHYLKDLPAPKWTKSQ